MVRVPGRVTHISIWLMLLCASCSFIAGRVLASDDAGTGSLEVSGRVFDDSNANGTLDAGERGLRGICVSDGFSIVRTGRDGSYRIASVDRGRSKFVFVTVSSGRRASGGYYRPLPAGVERCQADFALAPCPESNSPRFSFAQITDVHVVSDADVLVQDLAEIAAFKPSFVVATGDLVNDGRHISQIEAYKAGCESSGLDIRNVPGNHDGGGDPVNYESLLGPDYYSFDYGGCHLVIHNSADTGEAQQHWLQSDLTEAGRRPVLFFQHHHPTVDLMKLLAQHNTIGVFTGHWHTTKVFPYDFQRSDGSSGSLLYVNSPPLGFGGIDVSARGFVIAHVDRGKLTVEHRFGGVKQRFSIGFPADGSEVAAGRTGIRLVAYDSASPSMRVEYRIDGGPWRPAVNSGLLSWSATEMLAAGAHTLYARCAYGDEAPVEKQVRFMASTSNADAFGNPGGPGSDWPMLRRDASHSGISDGTVRPPLGLAWSTPLGGTFHGSPPVVVDDTVYVGLADEDCGGKAGVYALDARSGSVRWVYHTRGSVRNAVAVDSGSVYALSTAGEVVALDVATGNRRFQFDLNGIDRWLFSSPVVRDEVLYVGSAAEFLAIDTRTGTRIWTAHNMGGDWISCLTSPAVARGRVFTGLNWSNGLFALNRRTGKILWNNKKGYGTTHGTPTVVDGRVYHAADNKLHCANAIDGNEVWTTDLPGGWTLSSPVVADGRVFVGGPDGSMRCVDAATGNPIWSAPTGEPILCFTPYGRSGNPFVASPVVSGKIVYCGSGDGKLYAFSAEDGKVLWHYDLGVPITSSPAISGNSVYVTTFDGMVCAFAQEP